MGEKWEIAGMERGMEKVCNGSEKKRDECDKEGKGKEKLRPGSCMESIPLNYTILYPRWS